MQTTSDLAIVIVSWNVWDLLRTSLTSIEADSLPTADPHVRRFGPEGQATLQVIVVDNASDDATPALLPSQFPWVRTILNEENLGFTGGNNAALALLGLEDDARMRGCADAKRDLGRETTARRNEDGAKDGGRQKEELPGTQIDSGHDPLIHASAHPRFVYFLNPDTELLPNSLWTLYRAIEADDRVGVVGPQLLYGDGLRQSTRRRFPGRLTGFFESTWLGRSWPDNPWARRYHVADWPDNVRQDVDWLVGAAFIVRWSALAQVGGFDEGFFMYSEEMDLCKRLKEAGWRIVYDPGSIVIHYEGRSSEQISTRRHILFNQSKVRYYRKYFGPIWADILRRFLLLEFRWQIIMESLKGMIGHRRELRRERVAAYREVIESGLRVGR
jgi:N-acetylglucosaminyl-diphospho-decaprenol L-rhamnosyltransferase